MKYCSNCGQQIDDNANFCAGCGTTQVPQAPAPQPMSPGGRRLHCPKCKSTRFTPVVETDVKGGFAMNTAIGRKTSASSIHLNSVHRDYWMCQGCGHKFRQIENLEAETKTVGKRMTAYLVLCCLSVVLCLLTLCVDMGELYGTITVLLVIFNGIMFALDKFRHKKLLAEKEYLSVHCFD